MSTKKISKKSYFKKIIQQFDVFSFQGKNFAFKKRIEEKIILINYQRITNGEEILLVCFDKTLLIFTYPDFDQINAYFLSNQISILYYFSNDTLQKLKKTINNSISLKKAFFDKKQINKFLSYFPTKKMHEIPKREIIAAHLLQKIYLHYQKDRIFENEDIHDTTIQEFNINECIFLGELGKGSGGTVELMYNINTEKFYSVKNSKLINREIANYQKIQFPLLPRFYGTITNDQNSFVIEYISGVTLDDIKDLHLDFNNKLFIIVEIMLIIQYLHENNFIYRDLRPENIIIDNNENAILIDFDRMIENGILSSTIDFQSIYIAPEIIRKEPFSLEVDIYSFGFLLYFIIEEKEPNDSFDTKYTELKEMCIKCTQKEKQNRPKISKLIVFFVNFFIKNFDFTNDKVSCYRSFKSFFDIIEKLNNSGYIFYKLGKIIYKNKYLVQNLNRAISENNNFAIEKVIFMDFFKKCIFETNFKKIHSIKCVDKAIHYYSLASDKNNIKAQFRLGHIYHRHEDRCFDINKAIHHFSLAANQNHADSQHMLAYIYIHNNSVQDIQKGMHYLLLSANQNNPNSQYFLGSIYLNGVYASRDMHKAIHYLLLSADQNNPDAQFILGFVYLKGAFISRDINKAIRYLSLAADQNHSSAQYYLGTTYFTGEYISPDKNKGIHYLSLSADQNNSDAQFKLGTIYLKGEYISHDIYKAIHYFSLAADQNNSYAQFQLGIIYLNGEYTIRDIKKGMHYISLSADQNNSDAQYFLATSYLNGEYIFRDINKGMHYLYLAADQNNSNAQFQLGENYLFGKYTSIDMKRAFHYLLCASKQNNLYANYYLAQMYLYGHFVSQDINKAIYYFSTVAKQNIKESQHFLGLIYFKYKNDIKKAIHYFTLASNQNNPESNYYLGLIYNFGVNEFNDVNRAIYYFTLAANQNDLMSLYHLGMIYLFKKNDIKNAMKYLDLAVEKNHPRAQSICGSFYYKGIYFPQDINKAFHYLFSAVQKNDFYAQFALGYIYLEGEHVPCDMNKAIQFLTLSAKNNHQLSQYFLGVIYCEGLFISKDIKKALFYLELSVKNQIKNSQTLFYFGSIYFEGLYVSYDIKKAIHYFKEASNLNNQCAKNNLGVIYKKGNGVKPNPLIAIEYFKEAIKCGNDKVAMFNLAHIYFYNEAEIYDIDKAFELLVISSSSNIFVHSIFLLCLVVIEKFKDFDELKIKTEIEKIDMGKGKKIAIMVIFFIKYFNLRNKNIYDYLYYVQKDRNLVYYRFSIENQTIKKTIEIIDKRKKIDSEFYEGLGDIF